MPEATKSKKRARREAWRAAQFETLLTLLEGAERIGLDGKPAGTVAAAEAEHAKRAIAAIESKLERRRERRTAPTPPSPPKHLSLSDLRAAAAARIPRRRLRSQSPVHGRSQCNRCKLMAAIIAEGSGVAVNKATVETIEAVNKATVAMARDEGASAQDVAKVLKLDKSAAWRRLSAARQEGFIINLEVRKGMPGRYRTTGQTIEPATILPTTAELAERFDVMPSPRPLQNPCNRATGTE